jgi:hypothetical protein
MRFSLALAVAMLGIAATGMAQQKNSYNNSFKVKHTSDKAAKKTSAPIGKTGMKAAPNANSKDLKALEHQTAKSAAPPKGGGKKAPQLKQVKDKPTAPMNFGAKGGGKSAGLSRQPANPYKGRLKQKHSR